MQREDLPAVPQLAVLVILPEEMTRAAYSDDCPKECATGNLSVIAL